MSFHYARMTPKRHALIQEMSDRHLAERTIKTYVYWVANHYGRGPSKFSGGEIDAYLLKELIRKRDAACNTVNQALRAIRFFPVASSASGRFRVVHPSPETGAAAVGDPYPGRSPAAGGC